MTEPHPSSPDNTGTQRPSTSRRTSLVLATRNPGKVRELREIFANLRVPGIASIIGLDDLEAQGQGQYEEPPETETTFLANATLKAKAYAAMTGMPCLADDSGMEVDALDGLPGVDSAFFAYSTEAEAKAHPREVRDAANNAKLLRDLAGVPFEERTARFVCHMVIAEPDGSIRTTARGTFEGRIGLPMDECDNSVLAVPRGSNGFGYDPLFLVAPEFTRSTAELDSAAKHAISHRGRAMTELVNMLRVLDE
jgi:XTP/dITP diphosphohydrolase